MCFTCHVYLFIQKKIESDEEINHFLLLISLRADFSLYKWVSQLVSEDSSRRKNQMSSQSLTMSLTN